MPVDVAHVRPARLKDAAALAAAYEEAWRNAYQGIIPHHLAATDARAARASLVGERAPKANAAARARLRRRGRGLRDLWPLPPRPRAVPGRDLRALSASDLSGARPRREAVRRRAHAARRAQTEGSAWSGRSPTTMRRAVSICGSAASRSPKAPRASAMSRCARWRSPGRDAPLTLRLPETLGRP